MNRAEIIAEIERMRAELKAHEAMLAAYDKHTLDRASGPQMRFYKVRPLLAIQQVLRENGRGMTEEDLTKILVDGGNIKGKKRGLHNIRIGIERSLKSGALFRHGDLIGLSEWQDGVFK